MEYYITYPNMKKYRQKRKKKKEYYIDTAALCQTAN